MSFDSVSRDAQTLNLSRNVSKFYAGQVVSLINEQPSQNLLLKVDPLSTIRNNELIAKGEELETSAVSSKSFCIEYIVAAFKAAIRDTCFCFSYFAGFRTAQQIHFFFVVFVE